MRKLKLTASLLLVGVLAVFASAGSYAWFSDTETSNGNTFTSGIINISVDGQDSWTRSYAVTLSGGNTNLNPSQVGRVGYPIQNIGNNPTDVWKRIVGISTVENGITEPEGAYYSANGGPKNDINNHMDYDLRWGGAWLIPPASREPVPNIEDHWIYLGQLNPGQTLWVNQGFHLNNDNDDTNWAQSDRMTFTDEILALQITGAPSPVPELANHGR